MIAYRASRDLHVQYYDICKRIAQYFHAHSRAKTSAICRRASNLSQNIVELAQGSLADDAVSKCYLVCKLLCAASYPWLFAQQTLVLVSQRNSQSRQCQPIHVFLECPLILDRAALWPLKGTTLQQWLHSGVMGRCQPSQSHPPKPCCDCGSTEVFPIRRQPCDMDYMPSRKS
jgi:hypothetical protein